MEQSDEGCTRDEEAENINGDDGDDDDDNNNNNTDSISTILDLGTLEEVDIEVIKPRRNIFLV
jgi:hypothetical protein